MEFEKCSFLVYNNTIIALLKESGINHELFILQKMGARIQAHQIELVLKTAAGHNSGVLIL